MHISCWCLHILQKINRDKVMSLQRVALILLLSGIYGNTNGENFIESSNWREQQYDFRIINGTIADWVGTRYQVSLRLKANDEYFGSGHICGGALISSNIVLTAAHCIWDYSRDNFRDSSAFSVVLGNLDRYLSDNNSLIFNVANISTRSDFNITTYKNDLAILFLNGEVPRNFKRATPIALNTELQLSAGTLCRVSGWGRTETGFSAAQLMIVNAPIINATECTSNYGDYIVEGMLCAGYMEGYRDACSGDSGGPLVCNDKLVGLVSFGTGCALPSFPGIYTDVAAYVEWIRNQTGLGRQGEENSNEVSHLIPTTLLGITTLLLLFL